VPSKVSTNGGRRVEELERELAEAHRRETATAEILRVISRSPSDVRPVFDTIVRSAVRLCDGLYGAVVRFDGELMHLAAYHNYTPEVLQALQQMLPMRPDSQLVAGRAILTREMVHVEDALADPEFAQRVARTGGFRSMLAVPMLRAFSAARIELLKTFADQAVIAIENTRMFEAEQASKRELTEALEQQTATADVLNVISRSKFDRQPVFDAIVASGLNLFSGDAVLITLPEGNVIKAAAVAASDAARGDAIRNRFPVPLTRDYMHGIAILDQRVVDIPDAASAPTELSAGAAAMLPSGNRAITIVPLIRGESAIGALSVLRLVPGSLTPNQFGLLKTFADQAVIAIENARLFEEAQARNRDLTALGEVGRAVSSTLDLKVVLKTIVNRAVELSGTDCGSIFYFRDDIGRFELGETTGLANEVVERFHRLDIAAGQTGLGEAIASGKPLQIADITKRASNPLRDAAMEAGLRAALIVPLLSGDGPLGALVLQRRQPGDFPPPVVSLMQNLADQSVIAIENGRLFNETKEALAQQTAAAEVLNVISNSVADARPAFKSIATACQTLFDSDQVVLSLVDDAGLVRHERGEWPPHVTEATAERQWAVLNAAFPRPLAQSYQSYPLHKRRVVHYPDIANGPGLPDGMRQIAREVGNFSALIAPMQTETKDLGTIHVVRMPPRPFSDKEAVLLKGFADQAVIAIQNSRLFEEVQTRTRELANTVEELEIASQHKNQFVANMSHELRTPLAAILGYAELMQEGFYEPLGQKSLDALTRIRSNGKHLLGLINTVLDIAKIESGQFTLNMAEYAIESVVETVRSATESLAQNKKLALKTEVTKSLPIGLGDEQRLTQVLLNLVGNAIKFTDAGEVRVTAKAVNGHFNVSVTDTGPGIAEEHQARIFEQFHQVDSSNTKAKGGTGLGLAIAKQIVEMHGGRIWVESTLGEGSTFQMELPTRAELRPAS
jgi:signal transduction histidine kinase